MKRFVKRKKVTNASDIASDAVLRVEAVGGLVGCDYSPPEFKYTTDTGRRVVTHGGLPDAPLAELTEHTRARLGLDEHALAALAACRGAAPVFPDDEPGKTYDIDLEM